MFKLLILIFLTFSFSVQYCPRGYFSKSWDSETCEIQATPIQCGKFTDLYIAKGESSYSVVQLDGVGRQLELDFRIDGPPLQALIGYKGVFSRSTVPSSSSDYHEEIEVKEGIQRIGIGQTVQMVMEIYNPNDQDVHLEVRYFTNDNLCPHPFSGKFLGIIIGSALVIFLIILLAISKYDTQKALQKNAQPRQNFLEAISSIFLLKEPLPENPSIENLFKQTECSICLEEFNPEILCHQLSCKHIFHKTCIQIWAKKHTACPDCRVPLGKKAIEGFLPAQEKPSKEHLDITEEFRDNENLIISNNIQ